MPFPSLPRETGNQYKSLETLEDLANSLKLTLIDIHSIFLYLERLRELSFDMVSEVISSDPSIVTNITNTTLSNTAPLFYAGESYEDYIEPIYIPGVQGIPGTNGTQGIPGIDGYDGEDGQDGLQGIQGVKGIQGAQGPPGLDLDDPEPFESLPLGNVVSPAVLNAAGIYTPTITQVANLDASTAYACQYLRINATVTVSGKVDVDPTLTATSTQLGISLPIASTLATAQQCAGVGFASAIAGQGAAIIGDTANARAQMQWISTDITNQPMYFTFTYQIV